jgi:hypothetical protein
MWQMKYLCLGLVGCVLVGCGDNKQLVLPSDGAVGADTNHTMICPAPTVAAGTGCVLDGDVDLVASGTLELPAKTSLDCRGHKLFTSSPGTDFTHRSTPEIGILLHGASSMTVENCVIDGFDFGVFSINSKLPAGADADARAIKLLKNTITSRYTAVTLIAVDNTQITDNTLSFTTSGGQGVLVLRGSDRNLIKHNTITVAPSSDTTGVAKLPGPVLIAGSQSGGTGGIYVSQGTGLPNLLTAVISGKLYQWLTPATQIADASFNADNVIEANTITMVDPMNDISASVAERLVIRDNTLGTARIGMLFGAASLGVSADFPGTCSGDSTRYCFNGGAAQKVCSGNNATACSSNTDCTGVGTCVVNECFIADIDQASKGDCSGKTTITTNWYSDAALIERNHLTGPFATGIQVTGPRVIIQDNVIEGPTTNGTDLTQNGTGLDIRKLSLQSATIRRNKVSGFVAPLRVLNNATAFGAKISQNDFMPGTAAILVGSSSFAADVSVGSCSTNAALMCSRKTGGTDEAVTTDVDESTDECAAQTAGVCQARQGNYWGLDCATSNGFDATKVIVVGAGSKIDTQGVVTLNGSSTTAVGDGTAFGVAVSTLTTLPTTNAAGFCSGP